MKVLVLALVAIGFLFLCGCASDCQYGVKAVWPLSVTKDPVFTPATFGQVVRPATVVQPMYAAPASLPYAAPCAPRAPQPILAPSP